MSKIAFLFPGQGAQTVGMGAALAECCRPCASCLIAPTRFWASTWRKLCFEGPAEELDSTVDQPAGAIRHQPGGRRSRCGADPRRGAILRSRSRLEPGRVHGAWYSRACWNSRMGCGSVQLRGAAMQDAADAAPSGMVSILGMERVQVQSVVDQARGDDILEIANLLCPGNIVISGSNAACERAAELAEKSGAMKAVPLAVAGAFHTKIMEPAVARLSAGLAKVKMHDPKIPVVSNVDAATHANPEEIRALAGQASGESGALGGFAALSAWPRVRSVLRSRAGPRVARAAAAHRSQDFLPVGDGLVPRRSLTQQAASTEAASAAVRNNQGAIAWRKPSTRNCLSTCGARRRWSPEPREGLGESIAVGLARSERAWPALRATSRSYRPRWRRSPRPAARPRHFRATSRSGESVQQTVDAVLEKWEKLQILVNNAGITPRYAHPAHAGRAVGRGDQHQLARARFCSPGL